MRALLPSIKILFFLLATQAFSPAMAQETRYEVLDVMDLPPELNLRRQASCSLEFQEQWILNVANASISKKVDAYGISCTDSADSTDLAYLPEGAVRIKEISYEFSFLNLSDPQERKLQEALISLINQSFPIPEVYEPAEQLLSVYFHEDWVIEADHQEFRKRIKALTPVIWQERQTADGEPIPDGETGYPVYYKLKLERIELRHP
jgi:hypothetical protein